MASTPPQTPFRWFRPVLRRTEYVYADELLLKERRNLARRWWATFGTAYGVALLLIGLGWWQNGVAILQREDARLFVISVLGIPLAGALVGFIVWWLWLMQRPLRHYSFSPGQKAGTAFRLALGTVAECGWTPWEIDYDHFVIVALSPEGMYEGIPPQVVTVFCSYVSERTSEIRVQSRFVEATRVGDTRRIHARNVATFAKRYRELADRATDPTLAMPHPLARLKGRLPEEQLLAFQDLGEPRARARFWALWVFLTVVAGVMLHLQPWLNPWMAWPLTFIAAGGFQFLLSEQWKAQQHHALTHATATVIANPLASRELLWRRIDGLAAAQRWILHEEVDSDTRLYRERQPAGGYPGTYFLLQTTRNDAGVEQLLAVALPEWGLLTALMPPVYAPFQLLAIMQAIRKGVPVKEQAPLGVGAPLLPTATIPERSL